MVFHPVYVNNYNVVEAIFKYDVCHILSLRLFYEKQTDKTTRKHQISVKTEKSSKANKRGMN